METYVRTLQFEVDPNGVIVRVQRHGSTPCGAASFIGVPLADTVKPVGVSSGPNYHGVLGGHWPCQFSFIAGKCYDTVDVRMNFVSGSRAPKGCFATFDRAVEILERFGGIERAILVALPTPQLPESRAPGRSELFMAQEFLHDRLSHPLSIVTLSDESIVAILPRIERRILENKLSAFEEDCRAALSGRYSWTFGVRFENTPGGLLQTVIDCVERCRAAACHRKSA